MLCCRAGIFARVLARDFAHEVALMFAFEQKTSAFLFSMAFEGLLFPGSRLSLGPPMRTLPVVTEFSAGFMLEQFTILFIRTLVSSLHVVLRRYWEAPRSRCC